MSPIFTIGHSNHPIERFLELLVRHGVEVVADVRSVPASTRHPQYHRKALTATLAGRGIEYLFLGAELGARRTEPEAYEQNIARYERIARLPAFRTGLEQVTTRAAAGRIALMCAEREPLDCHRTLLVCRHLRDAMPGDIHHVLADGRLESHADVEQRLVATLGTSDARPDLFTAPTESPLDRAYRERSLAIAYRKKSAPSRA